MTRGGASLRGRVATGAVLALLGVLAWRTVGDPDVGLHLAGGRWIAEHGTVPRLDPFTWTVTDRPYVAYHWLFQLAVHAADGLAGSTGLAVLRWLAVMGAGALLADVMRVRRVAPEAAAVVGLLAVLAAEWRFTVRPELGSWLLGAAVLWVLERHRAGRRAPLVLLPVLQLVWANVHVHVLGLALVGLYAAGEALRERRLVTPLVRWGIAAGLACLANPYFVRGAVYPFVLATRLSGANVFAHHIAELASPFALAPDPRAPFTTSVQLSAFRTLWLGGVAALGWHAWRRRGVDAAMLAVFGTLAALAVRNTTLYVAWCAPALATAVDAGLARLTRSRAAPGRALVAAVALAAAVLGARVVSGVFYAADGRLDRFGSGWCRTCLALDAADWLASADLAGHGFNDLTLGSTLVWRDPAHPVFIDGRNEVTGEAFYRAYREAYDPARFDAARDRWGFEYVALAHANAPDAHALGRHLAASDAWTLAYVDGAAAVFVRKAGPNGGLAPAVLPAPVTGPDRHSRLAALERSVDDTKWWRWLWSTEPAPGADQHLGAFLLAIGALEAAEAPLLRAAEASPHAFAPVFDLGVLYQRRGLPRQALRAFRLAARLGPDHPDLAPLRAALRAGDPRPGRADGGRGALR